MQGFEGRVNDQQPIPAALLARGCQLEAFITFIQVICFVPCVHNATVAIESFTEGVIYRA